MLSSRSFVSMAATATGRVTADRSATMMAAQLRTTAMPRSFSKVSASPMTSAMPVTMMNSHQSAMNSMCMLRSLRRCAQQPGVSMRLTTTRSTAATGKRSFHSTQLHLDSSSAIRQYNSQTLRQTAKKPLPRQPVQAPPKKKINFVRIVWYIKMARIPFLIGAIYSVGYQQGTVDTIRNPQKLQQGMFETVMLQMGVSSSDEIDVLIESELMEQKKKRSAAHGLGYRIGWTLGQTMSDVGWTSGSSGRASTQEKNKSDAAATNAHDVPITYATSNNRMGESSIQNSDEHKYRELTKRVANVGREILRAGRKLVEEELEKAVQAAVLKIPREQFEAMTQGERIKALHADEDVEMWVAAQQRLEGEKLNGIHNWQYILVGSAIPNAFVSEMLPQRFFVTVGLFECFVANDDELAMVLGHELSHLLLGHMSESNAINFMLRGLEVFLLAMDPTEGLLSLGIATLLANLREALNAAYSRHHETEADELGCRIAAMACYDTSHGAHTFEKMHEFDTAVDKKKHSIMASHPSSDERFENLRQISATENMHKYSYCQRWTARIQRALSRRE